MKWSIEVYNNTAIPLIIDCTQGSNDYEWDFETRDYEIPSGAEVRVYLRKPSGKEIYNACSLSGNIIKITPTTQMTAEHGRVPGQIQIINGSKIIKTFLFWLNIQESVITEGAIESKDEFEILDKLISDARTALQEIEISISNANKAVEDAEKATKDAGDAANEAITSALAANGSAERANQAAENAGQATENANTAAQSASAAAQRAENAVDAIEGAVHGTLINDNIPSSTTTYSGSKIEDMAQVNWIPEYAIKNDISTVRATYEYENGILTVKSTQENPTTRQYARLPLQNLKKNTDYFISCKSTRTATTGGGIAVMGGTSISDVSFIDSSHEDTLNPGFTFNTGDNPYILILFTVNRNTGTVGETATFSEIMLVEGQNQAPYMENARDMAREIAGSVKKTDVVNNFVTTDPTKPAAAPTVKQLKEDVDALNSALDYFHVAGENTFVNDFLAIDPSTPNSRLHQTSVFSKVDGSAWDNIPGQMSTGTVIGVREVIYKSHIHVFVRITEFYPISGKQYFNFYNNGNWTNWSVIIPS